LEATVALTGGYLIVLLVGVAFVAAAFFSSSE
jgi:hypothetical protein